MNEKGGGKQSYLGSSLYSPLREHCESDNERPSDKRNRQRPTNQDPKSREEIYVRYYRDRYALRQRREEGVCDSSLHRRTLSVFFQFAFRIVLLGQSGCLYCLRTRPSLFVQR